MEASLIGSLLISPAKILLKTVVAVIKGEVWKINDVQAKAENLEVAMVNAQILQNQVYTSIYMSDRNANHMDVVRSRMDDLVALYFDGEDILTEFTTMKTVSESVWMAIYRNPSTINIPHFVDELEVKIQNTLTQLNRLTTTITSYRANTRNLEIDPRSNNNLIGRDDEVNEIIDLLHSCDPYGGVSITGLAGIGKTAVAQTINQEMLQNFTILWVHFWDGHFDLSAVIARLNEYPDFLSRVEQPSTSSNNSMVSETKFLIIFDNISHLNLTDWNAFREAVTRKGKVKFLITTRDQEISKKTGTTLYDLTTLPKEDCKKLIMKTSSKYAQWDPIPQEYSSIADNLASRCEGLPMVAHIIGIILDAHNTREWETLCGEDLWKWADFRNEAIPMFFTSVEGMEPRLTNCFAFLSLFPHTRLFSIDDLVHLLVGIGFIIQQTQDLSSWKGIGDSVVNTLSGRSLLQICVEQEKDIKKRKFKLNTFNQKFAQEAASKTCMRLDEEGVSASTFPLSKNTLHLSLCYYIQDDIWSQIKALNGLRTFLSLYSPSKIGNLGEIPHELFRAINRLRILALSYTDIANLPNSIKELKYLRLLDVSHTDIESLPETLCEIRSLQILKFGHSKLSHLPKNLHKLTNILYLDWEKDNIAHLGQPYKIGGLTHLQNLPLFLVGEVEGHDIKELQHMNSLEGSIHIMKLEKVRTKEGARIAKLDKKSSLDSIVLQWNNRPDIKIDSFANEVLECLKPHASLKMLKIIRYGGDALPQWISNPDRLLRKIHLQKCRSCNDLSQLSHLRSLKILILEGMDSIRSVDTSLCRPLKNSSDLCFPSLERLEFIDMQKLEKWETLEANAMPLLRNLKLKSCPVMINFSALDSFTSLVKLETESCNALEPLLIPNSIEHVRK